MQFGQYANIVQLAAALSMAGWVARTPDNPQDLPLNFNDPYNNVQSQRYHPYGQTQPNWAENFNNQNYGPMVQQQTFVPNNFQPYGRNELYQSKEAEETFRAYMELQELISWQESYRRGDLNLGNTNNQQYVLPVAQNDKSQERGSLDDGYATGSSIASPASSTVSGLASEIDEISTASSPSPDSVFDSLEQFNAQTPFSQIGEPHNTFDIDEILNDDDKDYSPVSYQEDDEGAKVPFSKLISSLDYVADSPLKSPGADSFLAGQSPEYNPPHTMNNNKFDPFQMQFANSTMPDKFSDTLADIADFDPSFFENSGQTDEEMDRALVQSLSQKSGASSVSIKCEDDYSKLGSPMVEHDYSKDDVVSTKSDFANNKNLARQLNNFAQPSRSLLKRPSSSSSAGSPIPQNLGRRTFAPESTQGQKPQKKSQSKLKGQKETSRLLWPDFPYTADQIINMPVEKFNEIIKTLDEIRQHVAKDVRRKGKNKLAARNCRKRKMDIIDNLDNGISHMELQRQKLFAERQRIIDETRQIQQKTEWLNNYIFEHLRDDNGMPYSTNDFSLQYTADGNVYLVPSVQGQP